MTSRGPSWVDRGKAMGVLTIAERLGFTILLGRSVSPCPSCKAEYRSSRGRDKRGPVGTTPDGMGWRCHRCGAGGDALSLAALAITGTDKPADWRPVREGLERAGCLSESTLIPKPAGTPAPRRTPEHEVLDLWSRCVPLCVDPAASEWALARRLDPWAIADRDLARALPLGVKVPAWAGINGSPWAQAGYRILLPMWDSTGGLVSVHARNVRLDATPKGAMPSGFQIAGLVFADRAGRTLLEGYGLPGPIWILEGVPDFLTAATSWGEDASPLPAIHGIVSGSWTAAIASRVPDGAHVVVAVHHDRAGEGYVTKIRETLEGRATLWRWTPGTCKAA